MPEQTDIPISSFPDAESITNADKVTGVQGNANKNFTFSSILAWFVNAVKSAFVPVNRTVNGKTLDTNITLTASDVGARPNTWTPSASDVGALPADGVLIFSAQAVSAGTAQQILSISDAKITADYVLGRIEFADPSYITAAGSWATAAGSFTLTGTCKAATTANVLLIRKGN